MSGFKLTISGVNETLAKLDPAKYKTEIQQSFQRFGEKTRQDAIDNAPADEGHIKQEMFFELLDLGVTIGCHLDYAAYMEFGTRKFAAEYIATLPSEWQQLAAEFRGGGGGTFAQLVLAITEWVHRKGLGSGFGGDIGITGTYSVKTRKRTGSASTQATQDKQVAYLIARKILRDGVRAQPFLYPAVNANMQGLLTGLKNIKVD